MTENSTTVENSDAYAAFKQLDEQIWKNIQKYAEELNKDLADIAAQIQVKAEEDFLAGLPDQEARLRTAMGIISAELVNAKAAAGRTTTYDMHVVGIEQPRKTKDGKKVGSLCTIAAKSEDESSEPTFAKVTFWDEDTVKMPAFEVGKTYRVELSGGLKNGFLQLNATAITDASTVLEVEGFDTLATLKELFPVVPAHQAAQHISDGFNDLRLVRGNVSFSRPFKGANGEAKGSLSVFDHADASKPLSAWVSASDARFGTGSIVWLLGTISEGKDDYPPSMNNTVVVHEELFVPRADANPAQTVAANEEVKDFSEEFEDFE